MKRLFYLLFCFCLLGCSETTTPKPANLIREGKMVRILADIHTVEAQVERAILYPDTALMTFNHHQQQVLDKHGVSEQEFRSSYRYYLANPIEMDKLYEIVIDTLSMREIKVSTANRVGDEIIVPTDPGAEQVAADTAALATTSDEWLQLWRCKLLFYQQYPLTAADTLRFYMAPALHNLPASCLEHYQKAAAPTAIPEAQPAPVSEPPAASPSAAAPATQSPGAGQVSRKPRPAAKDLRTVQAQ